MKTACHFEPRKLSGPKNPVEVNFDVALRDPSTALGMTALAGWHLLAQDTFHDIAPPLDYSLVPPWVIFAGSVLGLLLLGLIVWYGQRLFRKPSRVRSPRERALDALAQLEPQLEKMPPYQFSIRVSDLLRRYVLEQFNLPMTRQTSIEFLNAIANAQNFSEEEKALLSDFLDRCDLIKFARYEATAEDSRLLLDEAGRFVKGGTLVPA